MENQEQRKNVLKMLKNLKQLKNGEKIVFLFMLILSVENGIKNVVLY